jgi:glycosyltransferase involved in cell wall biosynthesis
LPDPEPRLANGLKLCLARKRRDVLTETFIKAHQERLPFHVVGVYGRWLTDEGDHLLSFTDRLARYLGRKVSAGVVSRIEERALRRYLQRSGVHAVLAEYGRTGVAAMDACQRARVPLVVHFHGYDAYARHVLESVGVRYQEMFDKAAAVIAVSRHMVTQLTSLGCDPRKLHYIPYGVDTERYSAGSPATAPPTFLSVGRFVPKKAPMHTISAFNHVAQHNKDAKLVMIGDGPLLASCQQLVAELGIEGRVHFAGWRNPAEVADAMRNSRCFVQHSVIAPDGDCEGTPVAIVEAGASGIPVVATRHAGIPDVVLDEQTGLLVAEHDIAGMAEGMLRLAEDPSAAAALGLAARERVNSLFRVETSIQRLADVILESATGAPSAA